MLFWVILLPFLAGCAAFAMPWSAPRRMLLPAVAVGHLAMVVGIRMAPAGSSAMGGWLAVDDLAYVFLAVMSVVFLLCSTSTCGYLAKLERDSDGVDGGEHGSERAFIGSLLIFLATMTTACLARHVGLLWVAIEATTIASAPLIYFHQSRRSLEATWKYLLICSVGIALALLGTFFIAAAASEVKDTPMILDDLFRSAGQLDSNLLKTAFVFLLIGYGTKMGLAPMHTWLPDAHSEAPSVVSALLSGVLLNCAFLGVLRGYQICGAAGAGDFASTLLLGFGLLSMLVAASFIFRQSDYKRMLAYSSVEHMGILSFSVGLGPAAAVFTLLHLVNHSLTKTMLFLTAGEILGMTGTKEVSKISGLLRKAPLIGLLWVAGFLAITGTPPFGLFVSEFSILGVTIKNGNYVGAIIYMGALTVVFIGMAKVVLAMVQGGKAEDSGGQPLNLRGAWLAAPMLLLLAMATFLGLHIPEWMAAMLRAGAETLSIVKG